jgi:hypothetical protein
VSGWPTPSTLTVTDSLGNTYSAAGARQGGSGNIFCALYYARNVSGGTDRVTVRASSSCQLSMIVAEFSGVDASSPLGATSGASGTSAAPSSGNMAPTMAGVLVIGAGTHNGNTTTNAGSGFTMVAIAIDNADDYQPLAMEYRVLSGTDTVAATFSLADSQEWTQVGALFNSAAAVPPG